MPFPTLIPIIEQALTEFLTWLKAVQALIYILYVLMNQLDLNVLSTRISVNKSLYLLWVINSYSYERKMRSCLQY